MDRIVSIVQQKHGRGASTGTGQHLHGVANISEVGGERRKGGREEGAKETKSYLS